MGLFGQRSKRGIANGNLVKSIVGGFQVILILAQLSVFASVSFCPGFVHRNLTSSHRSNITKNGRNCYIATGSAY